MSVSGPMNDEACYRPVIGGVAHLTWHRRKPPVTSTVRTLCGTAYDVSSESKPGTDECPACDEAFREYFDLPRRRDTSAADPSCPSATDPAYSDCRQQPTDTGCAPTTPVSAGHHLECAS
jgi:hypothetical protein